MRELEQWRRIIEQAMRTLVQEFKATFRPPRIVHLVVHHHGGYFNLRWRATDHTDGNQAFFDLAASERGRHLLGGLPSTVRQLLLHFERQRLEWNLASSLCQHELRRLRDYLSKLEALRTCERETPREFR